MSATEHSNAQGWSLRQFLHEWRHEGAFTLDPAPQIGAAALVSNRALLRLVALVFILPNVVFAATLAWWAAAIVALGCALALATLWRTEKAGVLAAPIDLSALIGCIALALTLCALGGEGHFFFASFDWLWRDAVLSDLVKNGLYVRYQYDGQDYLLRAPLGMYMSPTLVGRAFGLKAAHLAMLAQNGALAGIILYFASQLINTRKLPAVLLLVFFSGLDILPIFVAEVQEMLFGSGFLAFGHIEWWLEYWSAIKLQYSSHVTQLFWVPNHMAPGWWFAILSLLYVRKELDFAPLLVSFAALLFWSPLAMMGALPFLAAFGLRLLPRGIFTTRNMVAILAALCFLPLTLYLTIDSGAVPSGWLVGQPGFVFNYLAFIIVELPQVALIAYLWRKVEPSDRNLLLGAAVLLIVIPCYSIGISNDFVMRASIMPLFLIGFAFARVAVLTPRDDGPLATTISCLVILSFATPMMELKTALKPAFRISDCNLVTAWKKTDTSDALPTNYWARAEEVPAWLAPVREAIANGVEDRKCWPDHPALKDEMK